MAILGLKDEDLCLNFLITSTCNAGCSFCIANEYMDEKNTPNFINSENFKIFTDMLKKNLSVMQVNILGGEPSLHPNAVEISREIYKTGTSVGFSTNGIWNKDFRNSFEKIDFPMEFEITYLGSTAYSTGKLSSLRKTFNQLKGRDVGLGIIISSDTKDYNEHLEIARKNRFDIRWSILEPTRKTGLTREYSSIKYLKDCGKLVIEMVKKANENGIYTWADLSVPRCAIEDADLHLFKENMNNIQFKCPPFFDISPNLDIWRCLPLAPEKTPKLTDYSSFIEAYRSLNKLREIYKKRGVFDECYSCSHLEELCSGGPTIAKILKDEK